MTIPAQGTFDVKITPQAEDGASPDAAIGRMSIDKQFHGDLEGVSGVEVELVWDPYWTPEKMDPRVRAFLGF